MSATPHTPRVPMGYNGPPPPNSNPLRNGVPATPAPPPKREIKAGAPVYWREDGTLSTSDGTPVGVAIVGPDALRCRVCRKEWPDGAKFCRRCGCGWAPDTLQFARDAGARAAERFHNVIAEAFADVPKSPPPRPPSPDRLGSKPPPPSRPPLTIDCTDPRWQIRFDTDGNFEWCLVEPPPSTFLEKCALAFLACLAASVVVGLIGWAIYG